MRVTEDRIWNELQFGLTSGTSNIWSPVDQFNRYVYLRLGCVLSEFNSVRFWYVRLNDNRFDNGIDLLSNNRKLERKVMADGRESSEIST